MTIPSHVGGRKAGGGVGAEAGAEAAVTMTGYGLYTVKGWELQQVAVGTRSRET